MHESLWTFVFEVADFVALAGVLVAAFGRETRGRSLHELEG